MTAEQVGEKAMLYLTDTEIEEASIAFAITGSTELGGRTHFIANAATDKALNNIERVEERLEEAVRLLEALEKHYLKDDGSVYSTRTQALLSTLKENPTGENDG